MTEWVELHAHSYFSLLDASSAPEALIARAQALRMPALALTDHDTLAGAIRFWGAAQKAGVKPLIGAELTLSGGRHLTVLAESQTGYANVCALITRSRCDQARQADVWPPISVFQISAFCFSSSRSRGPWSEFQRFRISVFSFVSQSLPRLLGQLRS